MTTDSINMWKGAAWKLLAFGSYAILNALAHKLGGKDGLPVSVIVFWQDLFALLLVLPWLLYIKLQPIPKQFYNLHGFRIIASVMAIICWYYALSKLPLADAVAISSLSPLLGIFFARIWLKETASKLTLLFILLSVALVLFFLTPHTILFNQLSNNIGILAIALSGVFFALAKVATRKLASNGMSAVNLSVYLIIFMVPVSFAISLPEFQVPSYAQFVWLFMAGFLTLGAIYCVSKALSYATVTFLAPFDLSRFIFNSVLGLLFFTEIPNIWSITLIACLFLSGCFLQRASVLKFIGFRPQS